MNKIEERVTALALPVIERHSLELWDVEYLKEAGQWYLRVYVDKPEGVSIEDCEAVSRELDPILDEADPIPTSYTFEVSSAGAERVLRRPEDFVRFMGQKAEVKLYAPRAGRREYVGELTDFADGDVTLTVAGKPETFKKSEIAQVRLRVF